MWEMIDHNGQSGRRILVVDDDEDVRAIISERLGAMGFEVVQADNGQSCLSRITSGATQDQLHGVLLDLQMPELGGMAVLQELRHRHAEIPVIVMSNIEDIKMMREAIKLGAQEYLLKPFDLELLKTKCLRVFQW